MSVSTAEVLRSLLARQLNAVGKSHLCPCYKEHEGWVI